MSTTSRASGRHAMPGRWLLAGAAVVLGAAIWWHAAGPGSGAGYDFRQYVVAAQSIAAGQNPYHRLIVELQRQTANGETFHANGYVYPPLLALILTLPVRLGADERLLWLLWNSLTALAVLWAGWELGGKNKLRDPFVSFVMTSPFTAALILPAIATYDLSLGQADLLLAALSVGAFGLWTRRNPWAPVPLAAAIAIKPTLAILALVWLWKDGPGEGEDRPIARSFRRVMAQAVAHPTVRCAALALALVALPFAAVGLAATQDYVTFTTHWNAFGANADPINQSPYGMLLRLLTVNGVTRPLIDAGWLVLPLRLLALGGALALWLRAVPRAWTTDRALALSECLLAFPLVLWLSPLAEDIHYCQLMPALIGLGWLGWTRAPRSAATLALTVTFVLFSIPRMQESIFPDRLAPFPGQSDPRFGWLIALARTGILLAFACATIIAGCGLVRRLHAAADTAVSAPAAAAQQV